MRRLRPLQPQRRCDEAVVAPFDARPKTLRVKFKITTTCVKCVKYENEIRRD